MPQLMACKIDNEQLHHTVAKNPNKSHKIKYPTHHCWFIWLACYYLIQEINVSSVLKQTLKWTII